jgi:hypothetical protein
MMYSEMNGFPFSGSFGTILGVYLMTNFHYDSLERSFISFILRIAERKLAINEYKMLSDYMDKQAENFGDFFFACISVICDVHVAEFLWNKGRRKPWNKTIWNEFERLAYRRMKGNELKLIHGLDFLNYICDNVVRYYCITLDYNDGQSNIEKCNFEKSFFIQPPSSLIELQDRWGQLISIFTQNLIDDSSIACILNSQCKGMPVHAIQEFVSYGPVIVHHFVKEFLEVCKSFGISAFKTNNGSACAWISNLLWKGCNIKELFISSIMSRERMISSILLTSEGGYDRRRTQNVFENLIVNNTFCTGDNDTCMFPPICQTYGLKAYVESQLIGLKQKEISKKSVVQRPNLPFFDVGLRQQISDKEFLYNDQHGGLLKGKIL